MEVHGEFTFRERNDPTDWEMEGRAGTSYSIQVLDHDESNCKVKVPKAVWEAAASLKRGDRIKLRLTSGTMSLRVKGPDGLQASAPVAAARAAS